MPAFEVYRNGSLVTELWSRDQHLGLSLGMAAYDGEVGTGTVILPGRPDRSTGWWIGDRLSLKDPDSGKWLYTGYLMRPVVSHGASILEVQTTWQTMDINRQLIGRRVEDQAFPLPFSLNDLVGSFAALMQGAGAPQPTIDDTTWVDTSSTPVFPATTYNSDGATDWIADIIKYTAKTVYLALSDTENEFQLHVHDFSVGPGSGLTISDTGTGADTFKPMAPQLTFETTDLKDGISAHNQVTVVPIAAVGTYGDGGLGWEALLQFGVDEATLALIADTVADTGAIPKLTYSCQIGPLTSEQVAKAPAGSLITMTGSLWDLTTAGKRISRLTLQEATDRSGNPLPGLWTLGLQMDYPLRGRTAVTGFGGQGSPLGALSTMTTWTRTRVSEDDPGIPVGSTETAVAQLVDDDDVAVAVPNVSLTWLVVKDDADTPHPDYSTLDDDDLAASTSLTDISGLAHIRVKHDTATDPSPHRMKATPT